jgi:hypothetical protein
MSEVQPGAPEVRLGLKEAKDMSSCTPLRECGYALAVVVVAAAIYVGAYFAMMERVVHNDWGNPKSEITGWTMPYTAPRYRFGGSWSEWIFSPLYDLDRKARPEFWAVKQTP